MWDEGPQTGCTAITAPPDKSPTSLVARLPGTYTRESYGARTLTVRPDGTATMTVDVDGWYQTLVGAERITVQIAWNLTGDPAAEQPGVHFNSVSGAPAVSFDTISSLFGTERDWQILSADDESLVLFSADDDETEVWDRVPADLPASEATVPDGSGN